AAIVMIENMHRHLERSSDPSGKTLDVWPVVRQSAGVVGPALFFSLLVITGSFLPVFTLTVQEARLFCPLSYTKTYAMESVSLLANTLTPVLIGYAVRWRISLGSANTIIRVLNRIYQPVLYAALRHPKTVVFAAALSPSTFAYPL